MKNRKVKEVLVKDKKTADAIASGMGAKASRNYAKENEDKAKGHLKAQAAKWFKDGYDTVVFKTNGGDEIQVVKKSTIKWDQEILAKAMGELANADRKRFMEQTVVLNPTDALLNTATKDLAPKQQAAQKLAKTAMKVTETISVTF